MKAKSSVVELVGEYYHIECLRITAPLHLRTLWR